MAFGLLILRLALGGLLFGHGTQKLFGWFGGYGPDGTGQLMHQIGHRPGRTMAVLAGATEAGAGLLLALGFLSPLGTAMAVGVMCVAASTHISNGLWNERGGFELPMFFAVTAAALGFTGPGRVSVDGAIGWSPAWGAALLALVVGLLAAGVVILKARRELEHDERQDRLVEEITEIVRRAA